MRRAAQGLPSPGPASEIRRLLVIRACAIGDFVLNLPALRALSRQYPGARFTLVGYPETLQLAQTFIPLDAVYSIETQPWSQLFHGPQPGLPVFDAAWVWMRDPAVAERLRASGVARVCHADPFPAAGHAADHLLKTIGLPAPELPDLWRPGSSRVILHPGSGSPAKVWPYFGELAARLGDATVVIGPCEAAFRTRGPRLDRLPLAELAEQLRDCRLFIGNDSGITHIAAYWGAPTVALFGPTDPRVWGPVGRRVRILQGSPPAEISVEDVGQLL
jgi:ADP-heptose:LPS heptosyltransferase